MYRLSNTFPTVYFFQEEDISSGGIFHFFRRKEKFPPKYHFILPKYRLFLPKYFFIPPKKSPNTSLDISGTSPERYQPLEVEREISSERTWLRLLEEGVAKRLEVKRRIARISQVATPESHRHVGQTHTKTSA